MRKILIPAVVAVLLAGLRGTAAEDGASPPPPGVPAAGADIRSPQPLGAAPSPNAGPTILIGQIGPDQEVDPNPWNPPLCHANEWPYKEPLKVPTDFCGPPGEFYVGAEFIVWGLRGDRLPPLVTNGVPGQSGVGTYFGGGSEGPSRPYYGARFLGGVWFDSDYTFAVEASYFYAADQATNFSATSSGGPGSPVLATPFFNVVSGQPSANIVAAPGVASGSVTVRDSTELQEAEANAVWNLKRTHAYSVDLLAGFRYQEVGGELTIVSNSTAPPGSGAAGVSQLIEDEFTARNHFFGGQVGVRAEYCWHHLVFTGIEKLALGGNSAVIHITGGDSVQFPGAPAFHTAAGLLAQPSNIGTHSDDSFSVVNELDLRAGWQICDYVQAYVGWTFIFASSVVRTGGVVNPNVNPGQALGGGGPLLPVYAPHETSFWADGLSLGLEVRY